ATTLDADVDYDRSDLSGPCAVLVGNEAHGLDPELAALADIRVRIPMVGPAESLNAAMAGTLVCFEVLRQRRVALEEVATR
ncbi:MAG: RNA methyltransferase, partial [Actinobacteria bacterium]|nr:RNA methyltransferase [Actinomycetota bacterium]